MLVEGEGRARSYREAPEIDGIVKVPPNLAAGEFHEVDIVTSEGVDLIGVPAGSGA